MDVKIVGAGQMGIPLAYAMDKLGHIVKVVDYKQKALDKLKETTGLEGDLFTSQRTICRSAKKDKTNPDLIISALPFFENKIIAQHCIDNGIRYCDLGGDTSISSNIHENARQKAKAPVFTDLGLAPGWVNILAEEGFAELDNVLSVFMMVGGLPTEPCGGMFDYILTWSADGLLNEYSGQCEALKNGKIVLEKALDGLENIKVYDTQLEAFYTSGGAAHTIHKMKERGVQNCSYKTLRYPGHNKLIKFLQNNCGLSQNEIKRMIENACTGTANDWVCIRVLVVDISGIKTWHYKTYVEHSSRFSAMQRATAFAAASVADQLAKGKFDNEIVVDYSHVNFEAFHNVLDFLLSLAQ